MIRACLHRDGTITVHHRPSWLLRLLGWQERDVEVEWDGVWWREVDAAAPVTLRVERAIARELAAHRRASVP